MWFVCSTTMYNTIPCLPSTVVHMETYIVTIKLSYDNFKHRSMIYTLKNKKCRLGSSPGKDVVYDLRCIVHELVWGRHITFIKVDDNDTNDKSQFIIIIHSI